MKKVTTIEEYDNTGKLVKKTVIEEEGSGTTYVPYPVEPMPTYPPQNPWGPVWYCTTTSGFTDRKEIK